MEEEACKTQGQKRIKYPHRAAFDQCLARRLQRKDGNHARGIKIGKAERFRHQHPDHEAGGEFSQSKQTHFHNITFYYYKSFWDANPEKDRTVWGGELNEGRKNPFSVRCKKRSGAIPLLGGFLPPAFCHLSRIVSGNAQTENNDSSRLLVFHHRFLVSVDVPVRKELPHPRDENGIHLHRHF
jgi:hypothetical protein